MVYILIRWETDHLGGIWLYQFLIIAYLFTLVLKKKSKNILNFPLIQEGQFVSSLRKNGH